MTAFLREIKDFLSIYTWTEFWMIVGTSLGMMGVWLLLSVQLGIANDFVRTISIWALIIALTVGAATTEALLKHRG